MTAKYGLQILFKSIRSLCNLMLSFCSHFLNEFHHFVAGLDVVFDCVEIGCYLVIFKFARVFALCRRTATDR